MSEEETFNKNVQLAIESGVKPIELRFFPIIDVESGFPLAYRAEGIIHSLIVGEMDEESYTYVSDKRDCGIDLFKHLIKHAIKAVKTFEKAKRNIQFISLRCPSELVEKIDFYQTLKGILEENNGFDAGKLCLEFPSRILNENEEKAKTAILDTKALNVKTCIKGCGEKEFPISKMVEITPNFVTIHKSATEWAGDRNKPSLLSSLVAYVKSMGIDSIAEGYNETRKVMRGSECVGFICSDEKPLTLKDAIAQKVEED